MTLRGLCCSNWEISVRIIWIFFISSWIIPSFVELSNWIDELELLFILPFFTWCGFVSTDFIGILNKSLIEFELDVEDCNIGVLIFEIVGVIPIPFPSIGLLLISLLLILLLILILLLLFFIL